MLRNKTFHPFEIALCGYSGAGKTSLIEKLIRLLAPQYAIGHVKHDAHQFTMDHEGKDTWRALQAGAQQIFIHNDHKWAQIGQQQSNPHDIKTQILNLDFVLVEGHKNTPLEKIIVLGEGQSKADILQDFAHKSKKSLQNVLAFVGVAPTPDFDLAGSAYFQRDQIREIAAFILATFTAQAAQNPLYGLVLAGGRSRRMGRDKAALSYHQRNQTAYLSNLLKKFCQETFISCRKEQAREKHLIDEQQIHDQFADLGPMGGILSAFKTHPHASWLVIACDLPFVDEAMLQQLIKQRHPFKVATCFKNSEQGWPAPLCTVYEPKAYARLLQFFAQGYHCPRKMLMNSAIFEIPCATENGLKNANTPADYAAFKGLVL